MLPKLFALIADRKAKMPPDSYTTSLFSSGEDEILKKVGEEAMEVILAAKGQGQQRLIEETADLFYHLFVMLAHYDLTLADIEAELEKRHT
ncbi:MAG: phosphoribosyl-ATP diphosphatase [Anaerolineales bacterium]|nr:phosphoribosyl-ATP diphosphatase [Anaerolineales bacterium]